MTFKINRAPLLSIIKPYASFHHHMWIQTGVTVRKRLSWVVTLTFDLWPWPFAWTSLLSLVITPENFMMIRWWEHGEKGVTDGQTDRQTNRLNQSYSCLVAAKKRNKMKVWVTGKKETEENKCQCGYLRTDGVQFCFLHGFVVDVLRPDVNMCSLIHSIIWNQN